VEGEWKRCVCWLDYQDLILLNLRRVPVEPLEEAARVFPMTFRVVGVSPPPPRPENIADIRNPELSPDDLVWRLPVIHFEGESNPYNQAPFPKRRMKGTVRMLVCGAVRWSLNTFLPDSDAHSWHTEAVQIGGVGSALGFIGFWTGADHTRGDPLGPVWAWKVS